MIKGKTKKQMIKEEAEKDNVIRFIAIIGIVLFAAIFVQNIK